MNTLNEREMQNYLMHYGVKGMRWGVRKDRYTKVGFPGNSNYVSRETASYRNVARVANNKAYKLKKKADKTTNAKKKQKLMAKSNKKVAKGNRYQKYANRSAKLDKRASKLYNEDLEKSKSFTNKLLTNFARRNGYYDQQAVYEKVSIGKTVLDTFFWGDAGVAITRDSYVRNNKKKVF